MEGRNTQRLFTAAVVGGARDSEVIMKPESFCVEETRLIRFVHVEKHTDTHTTDTDKDSETHTTQTHTVMVFDSCLQFVALGLVMLEWRETLS